jgi:hypothetical protein
MDRALWTIDEKYRVRINQARLDALAKESKGNGRDRLFLKVGEEVHVPRLGSDRPSAEMISRANKLRGW